MRAHRAIRGAIAGLLLLAAGASSSSQPYSRSSAGPERNLLSPPQPADQHGQKKKSSASQQGQEALRDDLDLTIQDLITRYHIPSLTVGLLDNGKIALVKAYGHDPLYTYGQNNSSNPYLLGAVSQVFTGYAILVLQARGRLSLNDPLSKYLPGAPQAWRSVTIEQLLTHQSGLPEFPTDAKSFSGALLEAAAKPMRFPPGKARFNSYSDFDILGNIIEVVTGQSFFKFLDSSVSKNLKLSVTGDPLLLTFRYAQPEDLRTTGVPNLTRDTTGVAAGTLSGRRSDSDARLDTVRLMTRGIPDYSIPSKGIVSNSRDLLRLASVISSGSLPGIPDDRGYMKLAPGWLECRSGDEVLLTAHGISGGGFLAIFDVIPAEKTGLVLLAKLEPGSEIFDLSAENQEILDKVLAFPVADMTCSGQPASDDSSPDN